MDKAFNVAVLHICQKVLPCGFDISADAPSTFKALREHYERTSHIEVWNGASDKTIFGDAEVNYAFRAWHDARHLTGNHDFTLAGEIAACEDQCADILALYDGSAGQRFCAYVRAEVIGQALYAEKFGGFPVEQAAFAVYWLKHGDLPSRPIHGLSQEG